MPVAVHLLTYDSNGPSHILFPSLYHLFYVADIQKEVISDLLLHRPPHQLPGLHLLTPPLILHLHFLQLPFVP